ncbi:MAG TPA: SDR family NAD(P)-dependent oxidoreductase [Saprospiraceae bacterium]|nr:SDR family NAD(P)-dependent oxidoreductase [Saprospiraceae bacterium]HPN69524.1 SDR family NAD(P)-dependent oxidoreductase [Saprospiraceae bacterium]
MNSNNSKKILLTGVAGFIGHHLAVKYLSEGNQVIGIDNLRVDDSVNFKSQRIKDLETRSAFIFEKIDIRDREAVSDLFQRHTFDLILHLAARTGVRESSEQYADYLNTNVNGTCHLFDANVDQKCPIIFASSSSVYGDNHIMPFSEDQKIASPLSVYAASKASAELLAYHYSKNFGMPITALRFFTVYGPWCRKDMAVYKFFKAIQEGKEITLFDEGQLLRDFTFVDDIVESIFLLSSLTASGHAKFEVYNIGNGNQSKVIDLVRLIEVSLGKTAIIKFQQKVGEDMEATQANVDQLFEKIRFKPATTLSEGIMKTRDWFLSND